MQDGTAEILWGQFTIKKLRIRFYIGVGNGGVGTAWVLPLCRAWLMSDGGGNVASGEISEELKRFIHSHIDSVEQLEVLLLLKGQPRKEWNAAEVSQALFIQPASAAVRLISLHKGGLLSTPDATHPGALFRYDPRTTEFDRLVASLEMAYKERKHSVITLIFSKPSETIRVFSDAFKIRRDD